jgi:hypothetical protein
MQNKVEKLTKRFDRLSQQYTKCRDLEKMAKIYREMSSIVEQLKLIKFQAQVTELQKLGQAHELLEELVG